MVPAPTWLGPIRQTAFVVDDIEKAAHDWSATHGVGPWFLYHVEVENTWYRGERVTMRARMGLAQTGGQQIELIQPDLSLPSVYREFLESGGTGVHHVCYWANIEQSRRHFESLGSEVVLHGTTPTGNEFLYMSGQNGFPYIEFVDPNESMATFFAQIADAAINWNGLHPIASQR
jgi:hypothetical protein